MRWTRCRFNAQSTKSKRRPVDTMGNAVMIVKVVTGEMEAGEPETKLLLPWQAGRES
jgi:hypothetical protein